MRKIIQVGYEEPSDNDILSEDLVIHANFRNNKKIIILIHGLGGIRYGKKSTWRNFPKYLFEDLVDYDIGLYKYTTFEKRFYNLSLTIDDEAEHLACVLRDSLKDYEDIIFIGHSLGGVLAKATISKLIIQNNESTINRIKGLFLLATPNIGSRFKVPFILESLFNFPLLIHAFQDFIVLSKQNEYVLNINKLLENYFVFDENISIKNKKNLPAWAVIASNDLWVDRLSAEICFSSDRKKLVRGSHTSIVKPEDKDDEVYKWVKDKIYLCNREYEYDLYISFPMSSFADSTEYISKRIILINFVEKLKEVLGFENIYCEALNMEDEKRFEVPKTSLPKSIDKIENSKYYMLLMFENIKSGVTFEAGYAMALNKICTYFVYEKIENLPYIMRGIKGQIFEFKTDEDLLTIMNNEKENILKRR